MLKELNKYAQIMYAKYKFDMDGKVDANIFYKAKFQNDKFNEKIICNNLYKKIK